MNLETDKLLILLVVILLIGIFQFTILRVQINQGKVTSWKQAIVWFIPFYLFFWSLYMMIVDTKKQLDSVITEIKRIKNKPLNGNS